MDSAYVVSVVFPDSKMYMTDTSMMSFSDNIIEAKKFKSEDEARKYMDDHFIVLSWYIGNNIDRKISGVFIYYLYKDIVMGRSRYL